MSQLSTGLCQEKQPAISVPPLEAARMLSICQSRVYGLMRNGELESYQDGRSRRIPVESIFDYRARRLAESAGGWRQITPQPPRQRKRQQSGKRA
jgi:excisionase family DNA binding protein